MEHLPPEEECVTALHSHLREMETKAYSERAVAQATLDRATADYRLVLRQLEDLESKGEILHY
jgi:hypothetical protein|tara:strand:+ start:6822 stop:7010 length:189 start_codon:yes stop_codon:yes gene_type:complete